MVTRIFGRTVVVEGRSEPLKLLPWIHRGQVLLMGAEHDFLQVRFANQYTLAIRSAPVVDCLPSVRHGESKEVCHIILCHQTPEEVELIYNWHRGLSSKYRVVIAYGGLRENFEGIPIDDKIFIEDPSLRGPSNRMSHRELLEKAMMLSSSPEKTRFFFSEGDLVPLRSDYLDPAIKAMIHCNAGFLAKDIRNITASNNVFLTNALESGVAEDVAPDEYNGSPRYLHCLGCFFGVDGALLGGMIEQCRRMRGLYFEVMFPTAAARLGARLLSIESISDCLSKVRYRPFHSVGDVVRAAASGIHLIHPVRNEDLVAMLRQLASSASDGDVAPKPGERTCHSQDP